MVGAASNEVEGRLKETNALGEAVCGTNAEAEATSKSKRADTMRMVDGGVGC